jgi:hypothetical protein
MKTVEQAAQESRQFDDGLFPNWSDANIWDGAFEAGVEFAQRWISVEDELPEQVDVYEDLSEEVLAKTDNGAIWLSKYDHFVKDWTDVEIYMKVTHWRPIEYK